MHLSDKAAPSRIRLAAVMLVLATGLAACAEMTKPDAQCEPGVTDLGRTADLVPGNC